MYANCRFFSEAGFFFLEALISERYVMLLSGRWWKLAYGQIHDNDRTKAQGAKGSKKGFLGFCLKTRSYICLDGKDLCDIKLKRRSRT